MKLLVVDGNSILNRAYYGIRGLATKEGIFTNGIYGFLTVLLSVQGELSPDAVAIAFDLPGPTFRHKRYDGYKAQRKGMPDDLAAQMPLLKELLGYLGYVIVEKEGFEADDVLGTLAKASCAAGNQCIIATGDRDSLQLVDSCVSVRLAYTKGGRPQVELYDEAAVQAHYGMTPAQLIDLKALMGDASDNIPGVPGIGQKGATDLIQKFQSLDNIYTNLDTLDIRPALRKKLADGKDLAMLSHELAVICRDVPIDTDINSYIKKPLDNAAAYKLMTKLELFSLLERLGVSSPTAAEAQPDAPEQEAVSIYFGQLPEGCMEENSTIDVLFELSGHDITAMCIIANDALYLIDSDVVETAKKLLSSPAKKRTNQLKTLCHFALEHDFEIQNAIFDAEIAGYILNPTATDYSLERLAGEYSVIPLSLDNFLQVHTQLLEHCAVFSQLADTLTDKLVDNSQMKLFTQIELPLAMVLADMEHIGFEVDTHGLGDFGDNLDTEIASHQASIYELAGEAFNINSPKQLSVILFEKLGLPFGKKTKTGYSTNADVLESLRGKHDIIEHILQYRTVAKLKSTYVEGLLKVVAPDGRIHTSFQQTLTRTGRISSTEPNMQNIPIRTPLGSELRRFFRAKDGCVLVDADYSQIELRVLAHIAEDKNMIEAFTTGEDIHLNTAAQVFDMPPLMVTPLMRSRAKAVNFGIVYGIGAFSLSQDIGVTVSEADSYIKNYLSTYSGVRQYMEDVVEFGTDHGYVSTMLGRRRYLPELGSKNFQTRAFGKRVAMNTPIQGTAADIIKIAMVKVWSRLREEKLNSRLILQVHDELIVEAAQDEAEIVSTLVRQEMESALDLAVPLDVDINTGENWLDAK